MFMLGGRTVTDSFVMAAPIAASVAGWNTLLDVAVVRLLSRNALRRRQIWFLFRANFLIAGPPIAVVIAHALICPIEVIAATQPLVTDT